MKAYLDAVKKRKGVIAFGIIIALLAVFNIGVLLRLKEVKASIEEVNFSIRREQKYLPKLPALRRELAQLKKQLSELNRRIPEEQSDALLLAKVQTIVNEIANKTGVSVEYVQVLSTRKEKEGILKSFVGVRVKGKTLDILRFLEAFEDTLPSFGMYITYSTMYLYSYRQSNTLTLYAKLKALWRKSNEKK